ncbi:unnamed protein product [Trifolium pratense]|uniref:Uncharacterized protein n=1 Tax=Trifolium pratense TaxID=57577 RepID=A0ACB0J9D9_TRIPR|nr:unnamed protein product [Trifolium pratense]
MLSKIVNQLIDVVHFRDEYRDARRSIWHILVIFQAKNIVEIPKSGEEVLLQEESDNMVISHKALSEHEHKRNLNGIQIYVTNPNWYLTVAAISNSHSGK